MGKGAIYCKHPNDEKEFFGRHEYEIQEDRETISAMTMRRTEHAFTHPTFSGRILTKDPNLLVKLRETRQEEHRTGRPKQIGITNRQGGNF